MRIPWFGDIPKASSTSYSGYSNATGFTLMGHMPFGNKIKLQTSHYHQDTDSNKYQLICCWITAFLGALAIMYTTIPHDRYFSLASLLFLYAMAFALSIILEMAHYLIFSHQREICEWHSCEHKAVMLLESDLTLTYNNFMQSSKTVIRCGSIEVFTLLELYMALSLYGYSLANGITSLYLPAILALGSVFLARIGIKILRIGCPQSVKSFIVLTCVFFLPGLPAILPALLFERLTMLAPPPPEKIKATMKILRENFPERT